MQRLPMISTRRSARRHGFTLVEAVVSISIAALAASALTLGLASSLQTTESSIEQLIAKGMAEQLMDEVIGKRYAAVGAGPYETAFGPSSYEMNGQARERYDDADDYDGILAQPPEDPWGIELGRDDGEGGERHLNFMAPSNYFDDWRQKIQVYYVNNNNPEVRLSAGQTSNFRAVEVQIFIDEGQAGLREVANVRRIHGYIPRP